MPASDNNRLMVNSQTCRKIGCRTLTKVASILRIAYYILVLSFFAVSGCGDESSSAPVVGDTSDSARIRTPTTENVAEVGNKAHSVRTADSSHTGSEPSQALVDSSESGPAESQADAPAANSDRPVPTSTGTDETQKTLRAADLRPRHDDQRLAKAGILKYESKRLRLYTDIDPQMAQTLPPLLDQSYVAWEKYFGPLPPARDESTFQMTGYLMKDRQRFQQCGLLPRNLPLDFHGQQAGYQFWMNDQTQDYYRRHLLIHEGTHCFMTSIPGIDAPLWYMEGMAELFATHRVDAAGKLHVQLMPDDQQQFLGWGRISLIQRHVNETNVLTLQAISALKPKETIHVVTYAWAWALSKFLDTHPRYRDRFRQLARGLGRSDFAETFNRLYKEDLPDIWTEWPVFASSLKHGYDFERTAIKFQRGEPLKDRNESKTISIASDRGWQSSRIFVRKGDDYVVTPNGQFTVAQKPKPWVSEANGISFRYCDGRPVGMLLAAIRSDTSSGESERETMLDTIPIGAGRTFTAASTGTLYFRINDFPGELDDNDGSLRIEVQASAG